MSTKKNITVGDTVTSREAREAFYSRRKVAVTEATPEGRMPEQWFTPGMVGVVGTVEPGKGGKRGWPGGCCVDFTGVECGTAAYPNTTWRVWLRFDNITKVPTPKE